MQSPTMKTTSNKNVLFPMQFSSDGYDGYNEVAGKNSTVLSSEKNTRNVDFRRVQQQQHIVEVQQQHDPQPFWHKRQEYFSQRRSQQCALKEPSLPFSTYSDTLQELIKLQMQQEKIDEFILQLRQYPVDHNAAAGFFDDCEDGLHPLNQTPIKSPDSTRVTNVHINDSKRTDLSVSLPPMPQGSFKLSPQLAPIDCKFTTTRTQIHVDAPRKCEMMTQYSRSDFLSKFQKVMQESEMSPGEIPLPSNYHPDEFDVACGRGKGNYSRPGNRRFRDIVNRFVDEYQATRNKDKKSSLLNKIVAVVTSQNGGRCRFVRQDSKTGAWFEIGTDLARDKVGHAMREAINIRDKKVKK